MKQCDNLKMDVILLCGLCDFFAYFAVNLLILGNKIICQCANIWLADETISELADGLIWNVENSEWKCDNLKMK